MDREIMEIIDLKVSSLPARKKRKHRYRQYEEGKERLGKLFPGGKEYEYLCKAIAKKYGV